MQANFLGCDGARLVAENSLLLSFRSLVRGATTGVIIGVNHQSVMSSGANGGAGASRVTIGCDDIELAGELVQDLAAYLQVVTRLSAADLI